jgi:hypothetical protein
VPLVNFTANVTEGCAPLTVGFTDTSDARLGTITSWNWSFGDGSYSAAQNANHTYNAWGTYDVTLNASNECGWNITTKVNYITVKDVPLTNFTSNTTNGDAPLAVGFIDTSNARLGTITSWNWSFGDGNYSTVQNASYIYNAEGTYNVTLNATNECGSNITTKVNYINVTAPGGPVGPSGGGGGGGEVVPMCLPCDVNCDDFYDARDMSKESRIMLGLNEPTEGADCIQDGVINALDVIGVKRVVLGIRYCIPGDANCDGSFDAQDVIKVERIILGIDAPTDGADCNGDGKIDVLDATMIKRIALEI